MGLGLKFNPNPNLINEIKGSKILKGFRGEAAADIEGIVEILLNVSALMLEHESISQLDLNPVIAYSDSVCAVDFRIIMNRAKEGSI